MIGDQKKNIVCVYVCVCMHIVIVKYIAIVIEWVLSPCFIELLMLYVKCIECFV